MRSLELFSGCGGLAKGLALAGFKHCAFVERNKWACESLRANFNPALVHEVDIRAFDFKTVGKVDLIAGGGLPASRFRLADWRERTRTRVAQTVWETMCSWMGRANILDIRGVTTASPARPLRLAHMAFPVAKT